MAKGIVIYYSRSGNTKAMAEIIACAMNKADLVTECKSVSEVQAADLLDYEAIVVGSPTYYGPVSIGKPDDRVDQQCRRRGQRIAELTAKLQA
jgi:flavodoxin